jgi:hypothetical protein
MSEDLCGVGGWDGDNHFKEINYVGGWVITYLIN